MNKDSKEGRLSRKEREFQARRREIMAAAMRLFAQKGYHGTAMSEIAREAEFSTGSLYNFFKNKEELYFSLFREKIEELEEEVYAVLDMGGSVEERLRRYVERVVNFFEAERDFFRIFVEQRREFETAAKGELADVIHDKVTNYLARMVSLMEQGIKEGLFRPGVTAAELALLFLGITNNILLAYVNSETPYELSHKAELILDIFFYGTRRLAEGRRGG